MVKECSRKRSEGKPKCLTGGYIVDTYSEAEKGAWTFPSRVGKTASGHGRPCGRCDKAILLFFVLHVVTRVGVTLECAQCAQEEAGPSMVPLCTAIFYVQNVLYASKHGFCRMAVSTGPWR